MSDEHIQEVLRRLARIEAQLTGILEALEDQRLREAAGARRRRRRAKAVASIPWT